MFKRVFCLLSLSLALTGCINTGRYTMKHDTAPLRKPTTLEMVDQLPRYEPVYPWSLKPYEILGKKYQPLPSAKDYLASGTASWYGRKFHGHLTANGEVYDMYAMTAAHKTLPIPTFVRVTNLENNQSIIVRVNDRGPFHDDRIIDLSYSAAYALDMLDTGTAKVALEAIVVDEGQTWQQHSSTKSTVTASNQSAVVTQDSPETPAFTLHQQTPPAAQASNNAVQTSHISAPQESPVEQLFVQVLAASDGARITQTAKKLSNRFNTAIQTPKENGVYKLRLGPLKDKQQALELISSLKNNGYPNAYMLYTKPLLPHN